MSLPIGIVGLPNVGKSTLFKALTRKPALIANYPFATIDPNVGVVEVPDARLGELARVSASARVIPTVIEFVDIAGLVRGASQGEGLGNKFLSHIREVAAIVQVVRIFSDHNITHVLNRVNPVEDMEIINIELALADLSTVEKRLENVRRQKKTGASKELEIAVTLFERLHDELKKGVAVRDLGLNQEEDLLIKDLQLLTGKPLLYVVNCDEENQNVPEEVVMAAGKNPVLAISAKLEAELADLLPEESSALLHELGWSQSGLDRLIVAGYALLNLITFLTSGPEESRAWTIKKGTRAPQAAGVIHTDFEHGFIRAEICNWKEFVELGGEAGVKEKGLWRLEGKEYVMKDGDVCYFRFSV
ncbi:MAG TPA: redox-regulated ATPase YchF [Candidatus Magasanikbacteria bacterium]|nr:redox-regulated ATPase YchF [Candidatus Magasanikbacteria bacterium]